jgi:MraZ protein
VAENGKRWWILVFFGEYRHNMDTKGRLSIPSKMRNQCGSLVYVTRGNEGCLNVYNEEGWNAYYQGLAQLSQRKKEARKFLRLVQSKTHDIEFDKTGRINIPADLRSLAGLEKECVIIGVGDHMEIWNQQKWESYYEENDADFDELSEMLEEE